MQIPLIVVLVFSELLIILLGLSITLGVFLLRKPKITESAESQPPQFSEAELDAVDLGSTYIDFIEQAMERNNTKTSQQENIESEKDDDNSAAETPGNENINEETPAPAPNEFQSNLLLARQQFLLIEKAAAEKTEHEIHFWDSIYDGMKNLLEQFSSTEVVNTTSTETISDTATVTESKEKVFYIETQGKKIDGEVNKLKDIIYEQENALNSMKKSLEDAGSEGTEDSALLSAISDQIQALERQLSDSKMCMEVLEMENNRLQEEVDNMDARHSALFEDETKQSGDSLIDLEQMREVVEQQESRIQQLVDTIDSLEIDATQAEKLKETIGDFARTSKEMMSCIAILEEENEKLQAAKNDSADINTENTTAGSEDVDELKSSISKLEEEIIKKDVVHAQLQDEFTSMETEYLAMYEAMHGDNS